MTIFHGIVSTIAILIAAYLMPSVTVTLIGAVVLAVVLAIINTFIKPILKILTLPLNILTLGIFSLVLNALFIILASKIVPGFTIAGFWSAFWFSIILSVLNTLFLVTKDKTTQI